VEPVSLRCVFCALCRRPRACGAPAGRAPSSSPASRPARRCGSACSRSPPGAAAASCPPESSGDRSRCWSTSRASASPWTASRSPRTPSWPHGGRLGGRATPGVLLRRRGAPRRCRGLHAPVGAYPAW